MKYRHLIIVGLILGLAVVAYGSHPYVSDPGTLLDGFEDVNDWTVSGTGATVENDTSIFMGGGQSIKLNATGGNMATLEQIYLSLNFSSGDSFSLWYYVDTTKIYGITFRVTSTNYSNSKGFYSKGFYYCLAPFKNGWNRGVFTKAQFTASGSGDDSWDNTMTRMKLEITPKAGQDASVYFDDLRFGIVGQPKVIITFDDNFESQINKAYPIMADNGQAGVAFIYRNAVGGDKKITLADMQTLRDAGWDISNHGTGHLDLAEVSQEEMEADIDGGYDWLVANGFGNTAKFFASPYGTWNDAVIAKVKERHVLCRKYRFFDYHFDVVNFGDVQYHLAWYHVANTVSVATVKTKIDDTISRGGAPYNDVS